MKAPKEKFPTFPKGYVNLAVTCVVHKMVMDAVNRCMINPLLEKQEKERKFQQEIIEMLALTLLFFMFFCFVYLATHK